MHGDFIRLSCPSCGAALEITADVDRFICLHCGTQQLVKRSGGIISIHPLVEGIARVQQGTDKTAAELALRRLTEEIAIAKAEELAAIQAANHNDPIQEMVRVPPSNLEAPSLWGGILAVIASVGIAVGQPPESMVCALPLLAGIALLIIYIPVRIGRWKRTRIARAGAKQAREMEKAARVDYANKKSARVRELQTAIDRNRSIANS